MGGELFSELVRKKFIRGFELRPEVWGKGAERAQRKQKPYFFAHRVAFFLLKAQLRKNALFFKVCGGDFVHTKCPLSLPAALSARIIVMNPSRTR
jgi:hypothetical protein